MGEISIEQTRKRLMDLQLSEVAHDCFQAIGRIQCRTVVDGCRLAGQCLADSLRKNLQEKLEPVLQGAAWKRWETKYDETSADKQPGLIITAAKAISEYLDTLAVVGQERTSSKSLRKAVSECTKLKPDTLSDAVTKALEINKSWIRQRRGLIHGPALFA